MEKVYMASRYGKGEAAYLNCPMTEEQFNAFYDALVTAEKAELKEFEKEIYFEGCMPIEVMAARGRQTLLFGPLKPVGLPDPRTGKLPYAVVQLRQDNAAGTLYNLVGFQTHLKWGEQKRVFGMIPGLEQAEFVRYGVMHRNTFINSPKLLKPTYQFKGRETLLFAGQMTGVEGYVESAASGLLAGINAGRLARGLDPVVPPQETAHGSMAHYITTADFSNFQPMNANFGLFPPLAERIRGKKEKNEAIARRALETLEAFKRALA
jgi:methylenetetrahydrofolate--tRNA-(uracil-5-)-methyltransferase